MTATRLIRAGVVAMSLPPDVSPLSSQVTFAPGRRPCLMTAGAPTGGLAPMPDRYQELAKTPIGKFVVSNLGLPNPRPLPRFAVGDPLVAGRVLVGGPGRVRAEVE